MLFRFVKVNFSLALVYWKISYKYKWPFPRSQSEICLS